jgi:predicted TIM-barrel fold metal-dependent hydrolase
VKTFPNVYLDLCWMPWISPQLTERFLEIWLEIIPSNKFMWGGDAHRAECIHGHWLLAQQVVCKVLNRTVAEGTLPMKEAARIAVGIFRDNALAFFHIH